MDLQRQSMQPSTLCVDRHFHYCRTILLQSEDTIGKPAHILPAVRNYNLGPRSGRARTRLTLKPNLGVAWRIHPGGIAQQALLQGFVASGAAIYA
eukprot:CAMPEP_0119303712 /NCGR_PEP_ID=MMETSP1333-20130426/5103_1 /TAXON_ID=418940 /ORGANISM="Scyphosphaera apsteinii, Strain RCC1455" /LENGTH=94 /DNA_ID=CAMNT_0007306453 /DNA_START=734 /DNA_END=1018 /DNA_ORIENTATION=-